MYAVALVAFAAFLVWITPRLLSSTQLRRVPRAALVAWQAVTLGAIISTCLVPVAIIGTFTRAGESIDRHFGLLAAAAFLPGLLLARLIIEGHRVGRGLRTLRRRHRRLIDLLATRRGRAHILDHEAPTAYCLPGLRARVVITQGALDQLTDAEVEAALAHELAHVHARHDLVVEFFTVIFRTLPPPLRFDGALLEVKLLIELLADGAAARKAGPLTTAQALVGLAQAMTVTSGATTDPGRAAMSLAGWDEPDDRPEALAAQMHSTGPGFSMVRLEQLAGYADRDGRAQLSALAYASAIATLVVPFVLTALAWQ